MAMESGKHVYSAVPIVTLPDGDEILDWCEKLIDASKRTGRYYMLGETTYYRPETMYCRKRAAEGAFGEFIYADGVLGKVPQLLESGGYFPNGDHGLQPLVSFESLCKFMTVLHDVCGNPEGEFPRIKIEGN